MSVTFKAASWNVFYKSTPDNIRSHARLLRSKGYTILLLQEVNAKKIQVLASEGWKVVKHPKASNAVAWLPSDWSKTDQRMVELAVPYKRENPKDVVHTASPLVRLKNKSSGEQVWAMSYHLPSRVQRKDANPERLKVNKQAILRMDELAKGFQVGVLFGGDDNVDERHGSWPWMTTGMKNLEQVTAPKGTHKGGRRIDDFRIKNLEEGDAEVLNSSSDHHTHGREFTFAIPKVTVKPPKEAGMTRRNPSQYNFEKLLFDETILKKHFTPQKSKNVRFIVVHHMVIKDKKLLDDDALDACYKVWQSRPSSAQYGVDGRFIRQFVWDKDYAWASGTTYGNRDGIHIEHVNKTLNEPGTKNDYKISDETWKNGAKLAAYLHKKHKLGRPVKNVTLRKHSSFKATACPGPYMDKIWNRYVGEAQRVYDSITGGKPAKAPVPKNVYVVRRGDTLTKIATKHGTTWQRLKKLNHLKNANEIEVGQKLKLR